MPVTGSKKCRCSGTSTRPTRSPGIDPDAALGSAAEFDRLARRRENDEVGSGGLSLRDHGRDTAPARSKAAKRSDSIRSPSRTGSPASGGRFTGSGGNGQRKVLRLEAPAVAVRLEAAVDQADLALADEVGDEDVGRPVVDLLRRRVLLQGALVEDRDARGHRHRLRLIVRDVDDRRADAPVQRLDVMAHAHPQARVEVRQRLVEEEDLRIAHHRAAERDALLLAAGELLRIAGKRSATPSMLGDAGRRSPSISASRSTVGRASAQRKGDVLEHRHVRIERIGLEHHRDVAPVRAAGR